MNIIWDNILTVRRLCDPDLKIILNKGVGAKLYQYIRNHKKKNSNLIFLHSYFTGGNVKSSSVSPNSSSILFYYRPRYTEMLIQFINKYSKLNTLKDKIEQIMIHTTLTNNFITIFIHVCFHFKFSIVSQCVKLTMFFFLFNGLTFAKPMNLISPCLNSRMVTS